MTRKKKPQVAQADAESLPADFPSQAEFDAAFLALIERTPSGVLLHLHVDQAWALMSTIQMACHLVGFVGPTRELVEVIAREIQAGIAASGPLAVAARHGWEDAYFDSFPTKTASAA
jgi:hypothetical protein